jgi:hypothetical protein
MGRLVFLAVALSLVVVGGVVLAGLRPWHTTRERARPSGDYVLVTAPAQLRSRNLAPLKAGYRMCQVVGSADGPGEDVYEAGGTVGSYSTTPVCP